MAISRLRRYEEKRQTKQLFSAVFGAIAVIAFLAIFGLKILEGFSLFLDRVRGSSPSQKDSPESLILPPVFDPLPEATNSAHITVSGKGQPRQTLLLYVNENEKETTSIADNGEFIIDSVALDDGENVLSAKVKDDKGNMSELSQVLRVFIKKTAPILEVMGPADNATIIGEKNTVAVQGNTEEDTHLTINDRFVVVSQDQSFRYDFPLSEGANAITIVATDKAGNQTTVTRTVTYLR